MTDVCFWTDFAACEEVCGNFVPPVTVTPGFNIWGAGFTTLGAPFRGCTSAQLRSSGGDGGVPDSVGDVNSTLIVPTTPIFLGADYAVSDDISNPFATRRQAVHLVFPLRAVVGDFVQGGVTYHRPPADAYRHFIVITPNLSDVYTHFSGQYGSTGQGMLLGLYTTQADAVAGNDNTFWYLSNFDFVDSFTAAKNTPTPAMYVGTGSAFADTVPDGEVWARLDMNVDNATTPVLELLSLTVQLVASC